MPGAIASGSADADRDGSGICVGGCLSAPFRNAFRQRGAICVLSSDSVKCRLAKVPGNVCQILIHTEKNPVDMVLGDALDVTRNDRDVPSGSGEGAQYVPLSRVCSPRGRLVVASPQRGAVLLGAESVSR